MRLAASDEVVGRVAAQSALSRAPGQGSCSSGACSCSSCASVDPVDQLHNQLAAFIGKGFTPEAAAQLVARQPQSTRHR